MNRSFNLIFWWKLNVVVKSGLLPRPDQEKLRNSVAVGKSVTFLIWFVCAFTSWSNLLFFRSFVKDTYCINMFYCSSYNHIWLLPIISTFTYLKFAELSLPISLQLHCLYLYLFPFLFINTPCKINSRSAFVFWNLHTSFSFYILKVCRVILTYLSTDTLSVFVPISFPVHQHSLRNQLQVRLRFSGIYTHHSACPKVLR